MLLFSDVPDNTIYKWTTKGGKEVYLKPSGYTSSVQRGGEMGSNGLVLDKGGNLVMCQHGDRRMAKMDAPLDKPQANFVTLASDMMENELAVPMTLATTARANYFLPTLHMDCLAEMIMIPRKKQNGTVFIKSKRMVKSFC